MKIPMRRINNALFPAGPEAEHAFQQTERGTMYEVEIKNMGQTFTESQLGTFWYWMGHLAQHISTDEDKFTKNDLHDIVCPKFLGYEEKTLGKTTIRGLRTLTWPRRLNTAEKSELLSKIDAWGIGIGIFLPTQQDSEYAKYKEAQDE